MAVFIIIAPSNQHIFKKLQFLTRDAVAWATPQSQIVADPVFPPAKSLISFAGRFANAFCTLLDRYDY
jgi:hypothetical protein